MKFNLVNKSDLIFFPKLLTLIYFFRLSEKSFKIIKDNKEEDVIIAHIVGQLNNDLYAVPIKRREQKSLEDIHSLLEERVDETNLPPGWEKHEGIIIGYIPRPIDFTG